MIVNRRTFIVRRGCLQELTELIQEQRDKSNAPGTVRAYVPEVAPFDTIVIDFEFEDWAHYHQAWGEWSPGEAFWEKWYALTGNGGTNEVWRLVE
jgi:hypothetical protein